MESVRLSVVCCLSFEPSVVFVDLVAERDERDEVRVQCPRVRTCRLMLESGTVLPVSFAARFNCSLSLTRVRKSVRHFECLTSHHRA